MQSLLQSASRSENNSESASEMRAGTRFVGFQKRYGISPPTSDRIQGKIILFCSCFRAHSCKRHGCSVGSFQAAIFTLHGLSGNYFLRKQTKATPPPKMQIRQRGLYRFFCGKFIAPRSFFQNPACFRVFSTSVSIPTFPTPNMDVS